MKTIFRDAETGKIVTARYAEENPRTTVKETMKAVPKNAIKKLKQYQEWRQGAETKQMHPATITKAINQILEYFDK